MAVVACIEGNYKLAIEKLTIIVPPQMVMIVCLYFMNPEEN
jgi:hypothetical protein